MPGAVPGGDGGADEGGGDSTRTTSTAWRPSTKPVPLVRHMRSDTCRTWCPPLSSQTETAASAADTGMELDGPDRDSDAQEFIDAEEDLEGAGEVKGGRAAQGGGKHVAGGKGGPKAKQEGGSQPAHPVAGGKTLRSDNTQAPAAVKVGASLVEITTFNIKRNEFEHEYDNEAELLLGMCFALKRAC